MTYSAKLIGIETANPDSKWGQEEVFASVAENSSISLQAKVFYKRFLNDKGIQTRHFGMETLEHVNTESPDEANARFARVATELGTEAAKKCLAAYGVSADEVDALIVTTCTGYLCPGLTSYISEKVGFNESIHAVDLAGLGCGAAIPALRQGYQYLKLHANSNVLVISVEVCSAALSWGDEIDLILSNALFADGAAACLLSNKPGAQGYEFMQFDSLLWPQYRDELRFKKKDSRLCNVINRNVPDIAAEAVRSLSSRMKAKQEGQSTYYGIHPGGRRILDVIQDALGLDDALMERSRSVLRDYGNMSSPSVLYVLKAISENDKPKEGEQVSLFAFGAGFTAFGAVLKSDGNWGV